MRNSLYLSIQALKDIFQFFNLKNEERAIVFYAEDGSAWVHFSGVIDSLITRRQQTICYLTSCIDDPLLKQKNKNIKTYFISTGILRKVLFRTLRANVMVLTMPDLEILHLKRSKYPVHYIYIFHSMVSTHMIYRKGAFDHYDTIFCVGPHHETEIRETEKIYGLPPKRLVKHGYGRLDSIIQSTDRRNLITPEPLRVLIAPSWSPHGILETCGVEWVYNLLEAGYHVTVRPHPETKKNNPEKLEDIKKSFKSISQFVYEEDITSQDSLHKSHIMISDWSGAALEFAFCFERPVLFIDVPKKVNNPDYEKLSSPPIEVEVRCQIGEILSPDQFKEAPKLLEKMYKNRGAYIEKIRKACSNWIYNISQSGDKGAQAILEIERNL